jgi:Type IV pilin-like G and H, putative
MPRSTLMKIGAGIGFASLMAASTIQSISVQAAEPTIAPSPAPARVDPPKLPVAPKPAAPKPVTPRRVDQTQIAPTPGIPTQPIVPGGSKADPIGQQLMGQWQTKQPINGDTLSLVFATEGKGFLIFTPGSGGKGFATEIQYKINSTPQPMHIDFILPEGGTVQTLFEMTGKEMRMQLMQTSPGKPRPTAFQEPTAMQKVSDATALPPGVELTNPKKAAAPSQPAPRPQEAARRYVGSMSRAQQAYFLENNKFAKKMEELGLDKPIETDYRYQIVSQGNGTQQVMATGQAQKPGLKSYTGAVFAIKTPEGEMTAIAAICETKVASQRPPVPPKLVSAPNQFPQIACSADSQLLK